MAIKTAQFKTIAVRQYLANKYPYAAQCFAQDFVGTDMVLSIKVENWFKHYFPTELAFAEFRNMECQVTQYLKIK
jgi:hypothetical protein